MIPSVHRIALSLAHLQCSVGDSTRRGAPLFLRHGFLTRLTRLPPFRRSFGALLVASHPAHATTEAGHAFEGKSPRTPSQHTSHGVLHELVG